MRSSMRSSMRCTARGIPRDALLNARTCIEVYCSGRGQGGHAPRQLKVESCVLWFSSFHGTAPPLHRRRTATETHIGATPPHRHRNQVWCVADDLFFNNMCMPLKLYPRPLATLVLESICISLKLSPRLRKLVNLSQTSCPAAWNGPARSNLWYGLSSCSLCILGCAHMYREWYSVGCVICFQAVASYMADVWNCGRRSLWHGVDKYAACVSGVCGLRFVVVSIIEIANESNGLCRAPVFVFVVALHSMVCGMCYTRSIRAQQRQDMQSYFFFHACWHYSITCTSFLLLRAPAAKAEP
jgi:hypothetical protein